jgi:hypothetical protein
MLAPLMKYQVIATLGWIVLFGLIGAGLAAAGDVRPSLGQGRA